jgi:nitrous oxidase accessory protein NosD
MKKIRLTLTFSALLVALSIFAPAADAQVVRTFVSSEGKDNNPCDSLDKPCRNIDAAVSKAQAGGEVVILDSGNYQPLIINKAVSIVTALGAHPAISVSSGAGISVNAGPGDVVLIRGLRIISQGGARGIQFQSGRALHVESCEISGFTPLPTDCCTDGILVTTPSALVVKDTTVRGNFNGIRIFSSFGALIQHSRVENNSNGLWAEQAAKVTISDSIVAGNGSGITSFINPGSLDSAAAEINVDNCRVVGNIQGISSTGKPGDNSTVLTLVRVSNTTVTSNFQGLSVGTAGSGRIASRGNNTVEGNNVDGTFTDTFVAK